MPSFLTDTGPRIEVQLDKEPVMGMENVVRLLSSMLKCPVVCSSHGYKYDNGVNVADAVRPLGPARRTPA